MVLKSYPKLAIQVLILLSATALFLSLNILIHFRVNLDETFIDEVSICYNSGSGDCHSQYVIGSDRHLGKTTSAPDMSNTYEVSVDRFTERLGYIEQVEEEWWKLWYPQCAAGMIFYRRGQHLSQRRGALAQGHQDGEREVQDLPCEEDVPRLRRLCQAGRGGD